MLTGFVLLYLALTIGVGFYAARRVRDSRDFLVAGRSLPLSLSLATVFATWFGAETVLSVSAGFARDGLSGIPGDPLGAACALVIVGLFFARAFHRMDLLTIGDFYRRRYGKLIELITSLAITVSYLGWTAAQLTALGLVLNIVSGGALSLTVSIVLGAVVVVCYTLLGGMWAVALTDLFQTAVIMVGLLLAAWVLGDLAGGPIAVLSQARTDGRLRLWPDGGLAQWLPFVAAWATMALGTIPQQDVFQRVSSARDARTAVRASLLGAVLYLVFACVPMFIAYAAVVIEPNYTELFGSADSREVQRLLPELMIARTPLWAQAVFFGALLSAILSTASAALLAPTALFTENVLRPLLPRIGAHRRLLLLRVVLVLFATASVLFALNARGSLYEMVQNAYKVTLVGALVPLVAGMVWRRASVQGALLSVLAGLVVWISAEMRGAGALVPAQLAGLAAAIVGMLVGSLTPQLLPSPDQHRRAAR